MTFHTIQINSREESSKAGPAKAVALEYDPEKDPAPRVTATGQGALAEKIIAAARKSGVPVREDTILVSALASLDLNDTIPPELYTIVAEVLVYIYRIREKQLIKESEGFEPLLWVTRWALHPSPAMRLGRNGELHRTAEARLLSSCLSVRKTAGSDVWGASVRGVIDLCEQGVRFINKYARIRDDMIRATIKFRDGETVEVVGKVHRVDRDQVVLLLIIGVPDKAIHKESWRCGSKERSA